MMSPHPVTEGPEQGLSMALASKLAQDRYLGKLREVDISELGGIVQHVLDDYKGWSAGRDERLAKCCDFMGNLCLALSVPIVEAAYALYVLRDGFLAILSSAPGSTEDSAVQNATRFFDLLVLRLLRRC